MVSFVKIIRVVWLVLLINGFGKQFTLVGNNSILFYCCEIWDLATEAGGLKLGLRKFKENWSRKGI